MMTTEEFQMLMDTIKQVAGTAGTAGIVWMCLHYLVQLASIVIAPFAWCVAVIVLARQAVKAVTEIRKQPSADQLERTKQVQIEQEARKELNNSRKQIIEIADAAGVKSLIADGVMYSADLERVVKKVKA